VYLTGPWPATITLNALAGDSTVIIIVNEHGQQTTINADGTITTGTYTGGGSNSGSSGSDTPAGGGDNSGGSDTPGGDGGGDGEGGINEN
jgi:hypothetical protein